MLELLLIAHLTWTNPSYNADSTCRLGTTPLRDLATIEIWARPFLGSERRIVAVIPANGPGVVQEVDVELGYTPTGFWIVWPIAVDSTGNRSCQGSVRLIKSAPPTSVETVTRRPRGGQYYDLIGRRISEPLAPGVYWYQDSLLTPRRLIILR